MEREFWLERWRNNEIGFHQTDFNSRLLSYWASLGVPRDGRVLVPLCGKSRDMLWLADAGHQVIGVELSPLAIEAFFAEADAPYERRQHGGHTFYDGGEVGIYCADLFDLTQRELSEIAGVFDRGSLVALPSDVRRRYADHLLTVLPLGVRSLLLTIEYDQRLAPGPPFAVHPDEVDLLFGARCSVELLTRTPAEQMPPRFQARGIHQAGESTYRIIKER